MPAPTALVNPIEAVETTVLEDDNEEDDLMIDVSGKDLATAATSSTGALESGKKADTEMHIDEEGLPKFKPAKASGKIAKHETRKIPIPPHRFAPLKHAWPKIYTPLVQHLHIECRTNLSTRTVELRTSSTTTDPGALQKGADFIKVFLLGFDIDDAITLLRMDELYTETFEIKDVKTLQGEHLSRAIGRIAGKDGKTKFAIENATKTRVVLAESKIHILGAFMNIRMAREAIVSLILGAPPGKVYGNLRTISARQKERF